MRSKLFVPASRPELFAKALVGAADSLSFDLEDAVAEPRKDEARALLQGFLRSPEALGGHRKTLIVRINAMDTPHFERDVADIVCPAVHWINLPKPESAADVRAAADAVERAARAAGMARAPRLLLNIETPRALRLAHEIACAHPLAVGLQVGLGDLFEPYGVHRREPAAIAQVLMSVRMAAAEAGIAAYDGAFANIQDADGFRAEAQLAARLGFTGKTCIHPSQVATANEVFQPGAAELASALKVVSAAALADADGVGAYVVDGKMIDKPFVLRAQAIVAQARALGLIAHDN